MIQRIKKEVDKAIIDAFETMAAKDNTSFILLIGRADIMHGLAMHAKSNCVIDNNLDIYLDETRTSFYLRYMNRNYKKCGFRYEGDSGLDDLSIEMMIYTHIWESEYFLKSLVRLAGILNDKGYIWEPEIDNHGKWDFMKENVIQPIKPYCPELANIIQKAYSSDIRNAFAHSLYNIDPQSRNIYIRPQRGPQTIPFDKFQEKFLYSVVLMNCLLNTFEKHHIDAALCNTALTPVFSTPDGVNVQVFARIEYIKGNPYPRYFLNRIIQ
jgi:hypothetical protein